MKASSHSPVAKEHKQPTFKSSLDKLQRSRSVCWQFGWCNGLRRNLANGAYIILRLGLCVPRTHNLLLHCFAPARAHYITDKRGNFTAFALVSSPIICLETSRLPESVRARRMNVQDLAHKSIIFMWAASDRI